VVALYLKSIGWDDVHLSKGSRGPADIVATCKSAKWFIQVKASGGVPRLRGYEVKRLMELAASKDGMPVVSTYQPFGSGFSTGNYSILFYLLDSWQAIDPVEALECEGHTFSRQQARFP
jgi:hypothetical protein